MLKIVKEFVKTILENRDINGSLKHFSLLSKIPHFSCQEQKLEKKSSYKIAFIVPKIAAYSGGHTSILRLGTYLVDLGHEVYYIAYEDAKRDEMEKNAKINLPDYKGTILEKNAVDSSAYDIGIATFWFTCYFLLAYQHCFSYKVYFIQDFEPYFYPMGDNHLLALHTYSLGFDMISLGRWCKKVIEKSIPHVRVQFVDFPLELRDYPISKKKIQLNKKIRLAVYFKLDSKRAPFLLLEQLKYLYNHLTKDGYEVVINFFGSRKINLPVGTNFGKLNHGKILDLYKNSDFGVVASLTNISLVNYEMIASGLPVIDFYNGSAPAFFSKREMIFIGFKVSDLYEKVKYHLLHQNKLQQILINAQNKLVKEQINWTNTSEQFNQLLKVAGS